MEQNGWSISIGENEIFGFTRKTHISGLLQDPSGRVVSSIELQPKSDLGVTFGPRTDEIERYHKAVDGLTRDQAVRIFNVAASTAQNNLTDSSYELPPSFVDGIARGISATGGLSGAVGGPPPYGPLSSPVFSGLGGGQDGSTLNSNAFGRIFYDVAVAEALRSGKGIVFPLAAEQFANSAPGWGFTDQFGYVDYYGNVVGPFAIAWHRKSEDLLQRCFVAGTSIQLSDGQLKDITGIKIGDIVAAFHSEHSECNGKFEERRVTRLYENVTQELVRLKFPDGRDDLVTTPGHAFLDETGSFTKIGDLVRLGGGKARVIDQSGEVIAVEAEWFHYSAETADMFEQASVKSVSTVGNVAFKEEVRTGWKTYNFEVEGLHTYIAGGVRVHNDSGWLGEFGSFINNGLDEFFNAPDNRAFDAFTDTITKPLHWAGTALNGTLSVLADIGSRLTGGEGTRPDKGGIRGTGLSIVDPNGDGDFSDAFFVDVSGTRSYRTEPAFNGALSRTPAEELQAARNYDYWMGTNTVDDLIAGSGGGTGGRKRRDSGDSPHSDKRDKKKESLAEKNKPGDGSLYPILFDLDGDGIQITELSNSTIFMDTGGDGLLHRTAWAGAGDAVLFYDPDNLGAIVEKRQYVFTEWDPTATSDMEALRSYFDSNGDGVLDASDAEFAKFKLLVTNADGSTTAYALDELDQLGQQNITSIDLTADATNIELPDGSVIAGQTSFTRSDGTTGTAADVTLTAETQGYRLEQVASIDSAGTRTEVTTGYATDGSIAFVNTSVASADGAQITNSYDDDGDGVVDRLQTITTEAQPDGSSVKTVTNSLGAVAATAILLNRTVTTTSADGNTVSIERDSTGGGWFDQTELRVTAADGSMTIVTTDIGQDGSVIRSVDEAVSADGLTRTEAIDSDGDGLADVTVTHEIVVFENGGRLETVRHYNQDGTLRSNVTESVSGDGRTKMTRNDLDADGYVDTIERLQINVDASGSTSSLVVENRDGSVRSTATHVQSEDALTKSSALDLNGDGNIDVTTEEVTVIHADGSYETLTRQLNGDGSLWSQEKVILGGDKVSTETWVDLDKDGVFDATDLVHVVTVDPVSGDRTAITWDRNENGSVNSQTTSITSADGLVRNTTIDADGDGDTDTQIADVTTVDGNGDATRTVTTTNQDGSLRSETVAVTSADGLTTTTTVDSDGDGALDGKTISTQLAHADGSTTRTNATYAGDELTLLSESMTNQSADRHVTTTSTDTDGDGHVDTVVEKVRAVDGAVSTTQTRYHANGDVAGVSQSSTSANGLVSISSTDADGDGVIEAEVTSTTTLHADGGRTTATVTRNADDTLRSQTETTVSDDGLIITTLADADGDGTFERSSLSTTTLNADGSRTTLIEQRAANGDLLSQSRTTTSDDGWVVTEETDADGDGDFDLISTRTTTNRKNGNEYIVTKLSEGDGTLRSSETLRTYEDGQRSSISRDINGDGVRDFGQTRYFSSNGSYKTYVSHYDASNKLISQQYNQDFANGMQSRHASNFDLASSGFETINWWTKTLLDDGSVRELEEEKSANNRTFRSVETVTSDDGEHIVRTTDLDGDGISDDTLVTTTDLAEDGTRSQSTLRISADGSTLSTSITTISADRRITTSSSDLDGDGIDDVRSLNTLADNGTHTTKTEYLSSGGVVESSYEVVTSGDGRAMTQLLDRNGDGEIDLRTVESTSTSIDGTKHRAVEYRGQHHVLQGREQHLVSDDGMSAKSSLDLDGDGVWDFVTEIETVYQDNGDVVRSQSTLDAAFNSLAQITTTTSGNGLSTDVIADYSGDGSVDRVSSTVLGPNGGQSVSIKTYGGGYTLQQELTETVSADERHRTMTLDIDGDGAVDQRTTSVVDLSRNLTTTYEDVEINGVVSSSVTMTDAASGLLTAYAFDVDGDGTTDLTRDTEVSHALDGAEIVTFTEGYGVTVTYQEVTTYAANGLSSQSTFDVDGDGVIDGNTSNVTTINPDGSRTTVVETRYADGDLRFFSHEEVSADGRTTTREVDYDGNGIADKTSETILAADGSRIETESSFNEAGIRNNTFITTTSADGLTTTIMRQGNLQTITRSPLDNGSYGWDNGVAGANNVTTNHAVDALGIETWTLVKGTQTYEARFDTAAKQRLFDEAERIYDSVLDRGLDTGEREALIAHVVDGQLDKVGLIDHLMASGEYSVRYGALSDAEFITQAYMNAFGRAPSMMELAQRLFSLSGAHDTRAEILLELADSVEHLVVGNTHLMTNNFDVIMNPAVFERSLDEAYVRSVVANLVDVAYDRDATEQELDYLSELLLTGDKLADDIAAILLGREGDIQGVSSSSLNGLSGETLVGQAYLNGLGREPTALEIQTWNDFLSAGHISTAQFVASLALSADHLETGNGHMAHDVPAINILTGTDAGQTIHGNSGQDELIGLGGNDTLYAGTDGSDRIEGGTGVDHLNGTLGNDTYVWSQGDGNDDLYDWVVSPTDTDMLLLKNVNSTDVSLSRENSNGNISDNLRVNVIGATGSSYITVHNQFVGSGGEGIEIIQFADGVSWTRADILESVKFSGTDSGQTITGFASRDNILGLGGNDTLTGNGGDDTLVGGLGVDWLVGGAGNDTYVWSRGDGADRINEISNGAADRRTDVDVLELTDVNSSDVTLTRSLGSNEVRNDLNIVIANPDGDATTFYVWDQFDAAGEGIEKIVFADDVVWTRQDIIDRTTLDGDHNSNAITGLASDDNIYGHGGNDTLDTGAGDDLLVGGAGNDTLIGGDGGDTYLWSVGDGDDKINEKAIADLTQQDRLQFTDVNSADVSLWRENHSDGERRNDLYITINGTETIAIYDQFTGNGEGIEIITFADGVVWNREDILSRTRLEGTNDSDTGTSWNDTTPDLRGSAVRDNLYGLAGNDTIDAGAGDDWLYGGSGNDTLWGDGGNDTYVWEVGDGDDIIRDTSATDAETDTLRLEDVASDAAELSKSGNDLLVTIGSETITVVDRFNVGTNGDGDGVEFIEFSDGVITEILGGALAETNTTGTDGINTLNGWGLEDTIFGLGGNDSIDGNGGDDTLIGGVGNDHLQGDTGNDTYIWSAGDGNDTIWDTHANTNETDRLILSDITSDDVSLVRIENTNDLLITILSTGEVITIDDSFDATYVGRGIEEIVFADGETWDLNDIRQNTIAEDVAGGVTLDGTRYDDNLYGLDGDDTIKGLDGDDHLIGGDGDDTLQGGDGNDTYIWSRGDGSDTINDTDTGPVDTDTLWLTDLNPDDVRFERRSGSNDLQVIIDTGLENDTSTDGMFLYEFYRNFHGNVDTIPLGGASSAGVTSDTNVTVIAFRNGVGDHYGMRFASVIEVTTGGTYTFKLRSDDGSILTIDGQQITRSSHGLGERTGSIDLEPGTHTIEIAYHEYVSTQYLNLTVSGPDTGDIYASSIFTSGMLGKAADAAHLLDLGNFADIVQSYDVIKIKDQFASPVDGKGIESVEFADGTIWTLDDILAATSTNGSFKDDLLIGSAERDNIQGSEGADTLRGLAGNDYLYGGAGNDRLEGGDGDDRLFGGDGDDELFGGTGQDALFGDDGDDLLSGDGKADSFDGGAGTDTVDFTYSTYPNLVDLSRGVIDWFATTGGIESIVNVENVIGSSADNTVIGSTFGNRLEGRNGNDTVFGLAGNDTLDGGLGDDTLIGGRGDDLLTGGTGADVFVFVGDDGADTITDFENGIDMLDFSSTNLTFADLSISAGSGGSAVVSYGVDNSITLQNAAGDIDQSDVLFA
ncbi:calcium-binding protein [Yoonia sp. SDW83-1]|uniref:calcium-binding protein n=1 Tax=Yoonia sp. SDW83-1 TaxID=3366945 RepID=UPI00398C447F